MILGLDGIHTVSVALGKTHAVAISKHGHVYTWGLNNLNQVFQYHNYLRLFPKLFSHKFKKKLVQDSRIGNSVIPISEA